MLPRTPEGDPVADVQSMLELMREARIWPGERRDPWTDAFGVVLLVSLYRQTGDERRLRDAERIAGEVDRVLGAEPHDGLPMWLFALSRLGALEPAYRRRAVELARTAHGALVLDLGPLDPFHRYVAYRLLDADALASEIADLRERVEATSGSLVLRQDLALGVMLWLAHFFPDEPWSRLQTHRTLEMLDRLWVDPPGYFCRVQGYNAVKYASANFGISIGLEAASERPERRRLVGEFFRYCAGGGGWERDALTHVMYCASMLPGELLVENAPAVQ